MAPRNTKKDEEKKDEEKNGASGDIRNFTSKDLSELVTFDSTVFTKVSEAEKLSFRDAETILADRIRKLSDQSKASPTQALGGNVSVGQITANLILNTIPEEFRSKNTLEQLDLRPYFDALSQQGTVRAKAHAYNDPSLTNGNWFGMDDSSNEIVDLSAAGAAYLQAEQDRIVADFTEAQNAAQVPGTPAEKEAKLRGAANFDASRAGVSPTSDGGTQQAVVQGQDAFDPKTIAQQRAAFAPFEIDDMRQMVAIDQYGLEELLAREEQQAEANGGGYFPVEVEMGTVRPLEVSGGQVRAPSLAKPRMSVAQAMDYLRTLSPSEVKDMQKKLAAAGYYDRVVQNAEGGMANAVPIEEGYAFDPATQAAWRALLTDSVRENRPAWKLLAENSKTYRETRRQKQLSGLAGLDEDMAGAAANDYARSTIGRTLTNQERMQLNDYLLRLREDRAGYVVGADDNTADQNLPNEQGWTEDDIEARLTDEFGFESKTAIADERSYTRRKIMGG